MEVHLVDGTYELFRHYYGGPPVRSGRELSAAVGVLQSLLSLIQDGATHLGLATDHVVESFRNAMYPGYKTGEGIEPELLHQFHPLEDGARLMGITVWATEDWEADDAMAAAARQSAADPGVKRVFLCTPDKDLAQCVTGSRVVQWDRRQDIIRDADGVKAKFGVEPASIPDYLALVGDSADGFPGIAGWGAKSSAVILAEYGHLERIPKNPQEISLKLRGKDRLINTLHESWEDALLFRDLATLRTDRDLFPEVGALRWAGPQDGFDAWCDQAGSPELCERARRLSAKLS